jgi:hypothetical protein
VLHFLDPVAAPCVVRDDCDALPHCRGGRSGPKKSETREAANRQNASVSRVPFLEGMQEPNPGWLRFRRALPATRRDGRCRLEAALSVSEGGFFFRILLIGSELRRRFFDCAIALS